MCAEFMPVLKGFRVNFVLDRINSPYPLIGKELKLIL
jgi:hypothetical protein